ncbi:MAG TPA: acyl-CoA dehydratase activase-related protein, partial [Phycisphaerae bacterium]|nr:acyl-CoA dehydratase activase-related protein [Phycisphaerae bacterium]
NHAPFFLGYFTSLGVPANNIVFSEYTSEELYKRGAKRGAIDPCFPSKLGIPHVHDLLYVQHARTPLSHIFFPMVDSFPTFLANVQASRACPTVVGTAEATHAAFIKEGDLFAAHGIVFKKTFLNLDRPALAARQMYLDWKDELGLSEAESERATQQGLAAMENFMNRMRARSREIIDQLEREDRLGVVVLARPYHNDPGVNHEIAEELQKLGYPILWQDALPIDEDILDRLFGDEVRAGEIASPLSIEDVWKNSYSENTSRKLWAAKYAARHPNLVALELSSFKCGHDAPIYSNIEEIVERSGTPYFCFKDIDENKPAGSIKIRIETIAYFLKRYREDMVRNKQVRARIEAKLEQLKSALLVEV